MAKSKQVKTEYKLPNPLVYRLSNPGYTIYHRAALGGLAATIHAWGENQPGKITAKIESDRVSIAWNESISDKEFLRILLENSFRLTADKLIDLPGQQIDRDKDDLRIAIHNGISATFLQHNKMRPSEKEPRKIPLKLVDDDTESIFSYKAINDYAHKRAQGLGFIEDTESGSIPAMSAIPQWIIPGATSGASALEAPTDEIILLMYLMVGSAIFLLRPHTFKEKAQACLIVPNVVDLVAFSYAVGIINAENQNFERFNTNSYLNRVVGGAEEAALKFLLDYKMSDFSEVANCIDGCIAIAMGKVAWDKNQVNRSIIARVRGDYSEIKVFEAARSLGIARPIKMENGDTFVVPSSAIPELVAANLAAERHWCFGFKTLVSEKKDFERMNFLRGGLQKMKKAIENPEDRLIIQAFHEAWNNTMGELGERARKGEFIFDIKVENEREKMRNAILRAKTPDILAGWFLRFCADASKKASVRTFQQNGEEIRKFIFNQRNFDRFQNLCLFALVSYAGDENKQRKNAGDKTQDNTNINQSETTNTIQGA